LHLLRGYGPLGPNSRRLLAADSRATRSATRSPASGARSVALRVIGWQRCPLSSTPRDSRHEGSGGSAWELPSPASIRRPVMRALLPRESALPPTPSTEPVLFLRARAPVGSTPFDVCHADPLRVVAAGRAFTTMLRRPLTSSCRLRAPSKRHHPSRADRASSFPRTPDLRRRPCDRRLVQRMLAHPPEAPTPPPFDCVIGEYPPARTALAKPR
jgi:hypothetical protein